MKLGRRAVAAYRVPVRRTALFAIVVISAAGVGVVAAFALRESGSSLAARRVAPDVARVVCDTGAVRLAAVAVQASENGVRFVVENPSRAQLLQIRDPRRDSPLAELPLLAGAPSEATFAIGPGRVQVACLPDRASGGPAAVLSILDPDDRWISPALSCSETSSIRFQAPFAAGAEDAAQTARRTVPGIEPSDEVAKPGYPGSLWHGDLVVVIRDDRTVGRVTRAHDQGTWSVAVTACASSPLAAR